MPVNYFVNVRMITKNNLLEFIEASRKEDSNMELKTILAKFSLRTGYKVSTLQVYLTELKEAGLVT